VKVYAQSKDHSYGSEHFFCLSMITVVIAVGIIAMLGIIGFVLSYTKFADSKFEEIISKIYRILLFLPVVTVLFSMVFTYYKWLSDLRLGFYIILILSVALPIPALLLKILKKLD